ncbi:MAG: hypothetical protein ACK5RA_09565, partial [Cyanobacteriota bacterium]
EQILLRESINYRIIFRGGHGLMKFFAFSRQIFASVRTLPGDDLAALVEELTSIFSAQLSSRLSGLFHSELRAPWLWLWRSAGC